jgi:hypothetical protein
MGWTMLRAPGERGGPCKEFCRHSDCRSIRLIAAAPCRLCEREIGYLEPFYEEVTKGKKKRAQPAKLSERRAYVHAKCAHEEAGS